jgi:hypothetical protein
MMHATIIHDEPHRGRSTGRAENTVGNRECNIPYIASVQGAAVTGSSPVRPHMLVTAKPPALRERNLQRCKQQQQQQQSMRSSISSSSSECAHPQ